MKILPATQLLRSHQVCAQSVRLRRHVPEAPRLSVFPLKSVLQILVSCRLSELGCGVALSSAHNVRRARVNKIR
ncbi:MAG: hypothetical protein DMF01_07285 [Verrucomicrobia bacterium]|nr:MAG: hypothetical protein DMF01_07285 [Verrucomicrobiota bacterium]